MLKRPQSAAPTSPSKHSNKKSLTSSTRSSTSSMIDSTESRPKSAIKRASGQAYLAGAGLWGKNQKIQKKIRPATAGGVHKVRKVVKVRNTKHLRSVKSTQEKLGKNAAQLHNGRDSYIYPSSRPNSSHVTLSRVNPDNDSGYGKNYDPNSSSISNISRPVSAFNYGGFRRSGVERGRPNSSTLSVRPLSSISHSSIISGGSIEGVSERRLRYPPWSQPPNQDAFSRNPSARLQSRSRSTRPGSSRPGSSRPGSSRPGSSRPGSSRPGSRGSNNLGFKKRPISSMSSTSISGSQLSEDYATTSWSRPLSRGDMHSRPGSRGTAGGGEYYYEDDTYIEDGEEDDPFLTWQRRENVALEQGYLSLGMSKSRRPSSAASTSPDSRNRNKRGEVRPHSPEPLVPHPKGGKLRAKSAHGIVSAHTGIHHSNYITGVEKLILKKNENQPDPWDVHLNATIPRPRNAISVVAPPTAPVRRPTTALLRGTPQENTRPWSTDPGLLARARANKAPALIHLNDGRPHTIGESRHAEPYSKLVTYFDAFQLTGSHVEARRMMSTQHRLLSESRIRDYEHWESDKTDLHKQKQATKRWGTSGEFPMENPVTRSILRQREENEQKQLDLLTKSAFKSGKLKYIQHAEKVRERVETAKRARSANPNRRPKSSIETGTIKINQWDQHERGGVRSGSLKLPGASSNDAKSGDKIDTPKKRTREEEAFHASMMTSYGTGEIEVLWQNLKSIPKSIMMCSLALQCQHLTALRLSGNKITVLPKWLFPSLHSLIELNVSNNKLTKIPENIEVLIHLRKLTVSYNRIAVLPSTVSKCINLRLLDCSGNLIRTLPPTISGLRFLVVFRCGDNDLRFLSGGVEHLVALEELILTRNRLGTLALIQPLIIRKAREDDIWEKSRIQYTHKHSEIIYMNQTTGETLRRAPQGANIMEASGFVPSDSDSDDEELLEQERENLFSKEPMTEEEEKEDIRWKNKLRKRAERLQLRNDLAEEGKGIWEVQWAKFTGTAYYYNHFEKIKQDVMPPQLDKIGFLPMIKRLVISFNVLQELPSSIGRLVRLEELIVDHNKLKSLPDEIGTMFNLKFLSFADNRLETLPATIGTLKRLHRINGTYNHMKKLPVELSKLTGLVQLWLSNNKLEVLPNELWTMTSLTEIHLADNPLKEPRLDVVEKGVTFLLRDLKERWLRLNVLGTPPTVSTVGVGVRGEIIMPEPRYKKILENILRHAKKSNSLEMQWKELHHVPVGAFDLIELSELRLQNNFLKAAAITAEFRVFKNLVLLSLSNNQLHEFPVVLLKVTSIMHLDLSNNFIPELPEKIDRMYRLQTINLSQNRLTSLPEKFGKLIDLNSINLDINHIGPTLPKSIINLYKLTTLKLVQNRLKTLPLGLMNLTSLTLLNLNSNIIGPSLPDDISFMPHLTDLKLSHNRIKILPTSFCLNDLCHCLEKLWLYGNRIIQLPHDFRFLTTLTDLRIEHNPMISPPTILSLQGPERIRVYCADRLERITLLKNILHQEHIRFNSDSLIPRSINVFTEGTDYLTDEDLKEFDATVDRTLNGPYYNHKMDVHELVRFMNDKKLKRRIAHHKLLLENFLTFLEVAIDKNVLSPKYFREDLIRPMGEEGKDEECYALKLEPLYEKKIGVNLPSVQRRLDEEEAARRAALEKLLAAGENEAQLNIPEPAVQDPPPANSILDITNDIFRTKKRPEFDYPLWQLREAATEWVGPFGKVACFEHGLTFEDVQGYEQARLDLEVVTEKIKRLKKGWKQAKQRIAEAQKKHDAEVAREREAAEEERAERKAAEEKASGETKVNDEIASTEGGGEGNNDNSATTTVVGDKGDLLILREYDKLLKKSNELKELKKTCEQVSHNDVCVILKIVYTKDEIRREKREDYDSRVGEIEVRKEVEAWLETKHGKKAMENRIKEVRKFFKSQLKLVRDEIKNLLKNKPKLLKDFEKMKKRKKAFDKGKKIDFHNFNTLDEAIEAMKLVQTPIDEMNAKEAELREIEESRLALTVKVKKELPLVKEEQKIALVDRYGEKERKRIIEEGRVFARDNGLRRPWDGPAGRAFRIWKEKADNLLEELLNPPSDTPSSSSTDMSTDSEPELDETSAASVERHKKWKKIHDEKLLANKYRWGRLLTDDQKLKQAQRAEARRLAIFKYSKPTEQEEKDADEMDAKNNAEDGDDEEDEDNDDEGGNDKDSIGQHGDEYDKNNDDSVKSKENERSESRIVDEESKTVEVQSPEDEDSGDEMKMN